MTARVMTARVLTARVLTARVLTARVLTARVLTARVLTARRLSPSECGGPGAAPGVVRLGPPEAGMSIRSSYVAREAA